MPLSAAYRIKLQELTEKGLSGEALINALDKAMSEQPTIAEATEKELEPESAEYK